eukprot:CAMPEP_0182887222 /NCGR_PEP_ID=MMETSP0034_2-20130328/20695_1 /TAXON_ID=156128 /ORGANISM="Nephroselmis pyriformis, Strain CCMP717" /LENGTH=104 /DNA_ID=CAMNT_0025020579 /DNA_START=1 /DNA_END=312 /DNA_ORIENTATION=+
MASSSSTGQSAGEGGSSSPVVLSDPADSESAEALSQALGYHAIDRARYPTEASDEEVAKAFGVDREVSALVVIFSESTSDDWIAGLCAFQINAALKEYTEVYPV